MPPSASHESCSALPISTSSAYGVGLEKVSWRTKVGPCSSRDSPQDRRMTAATEPTTTGHRHVTGRRIRPAGCARVKGAGLMSQGGSAPREPFGPLSTGGPSWSRRQIGLSYQLADAVQRHL